MGGGGRRGGVGGEEGRGGERGKRIVKCTFKLKTLLSHITGSSEAVGALRMTDSVD